MIFKVIRMPDMSEYGQYIYTASLTADITVICVYKAINRSDNVILDLYKNDISEDTKIVSGRVLVPDSLICTPKTSQDFNYYVNCVDMDDVSCNIMPTNLSQFYLQFTENEDNPELKQEFENESNSI